MTYHQSQSFATQVSEHLGGADVHNVHVARGDRLPQPSRRHHDQRVHRGEEGSAEFTVLTFTCRCQCCRAKVTAFLLPCRRHHDQRTYQETKEPRHTLFEMGEPLSYTNSK